MTYLEHYGVKGMKWGVRKERSTKGYLRKANNIVSTMSKKERELLGVYDRQYSIDKGEKFLIKYIKYIEDIPVSFFDIVGGGQGMPMSQLGRVPEKNIEEKVMLKKSSKMGSIGGMLTKTNMVMKSLIGGFAEIIQAPLN